MSSGPESRPPPVLIVEDLVAGYGSSRVLDGVSFSLGQGEIVSVIGPNGAGKSTLLKAIFGLAEVRGGTISLAGEAIQGIAPKRRLSKGVAIVLQGRSNFPEMTVRENLELGGFTLSARDTKERIQKIYERFPLLGERSSARARTLSGGQQQLLEMGIALMLRPRVLLVDEPSLGLDPKNSRTVFGLLREIREVDNVAILVVEQNASQALKSSAWAYVLDQGKNRVDGPAAALLEDETVKTLYLGRVPAEDSS